MKFFADWEIEYKFADETVAATRDGYGYCFRR